MINYIKNNLLEEADRWVLWIPVFYGVGIGIYFGLFNEPSWYVCGGAIFSAAVLLGVCWRNLALRLLFIALLISALGFLTAKINGVEAASKVIEKLDDPVTISGNVESITEAKGFPVLTLTNLRIDEIDQAHLPDSVHLYVRTKFKEPVKPGDRIITDAKLYPPGRPALPGGYDFAKFAYFDGVGADGFAVRRIIKLKKGGEEDWLGNLRFEISNRIRAAVPGDDGAMNDAIITGDRSRISAEGYDNMRHSGLAHLIAVSGINLVLAAGTVFFSVRLLLSFFPRFSEVYSSKKLAAFFALLSSTAYVEISGMQVPAVRSYIMIVIVMLGIMFSRQASPIRGVGVSALLVLMFYPQSLLGPSFQLTYAATVALISIFEMFKKKYDEEEFDDRGKIGWRHNLWRKIWVYPATVLGSSFIGGMATAPYSAFTFNQFVNYGLLANLGAIPLTSVIIMPFAVLGMVLMPLHLEAIGLVPMGWGNHGVFWIADKVAHMSGSYVHVPQISTWGLCLITLGGLWFLLWQRRWRWFGFVIIAIGVSSMAFAKVPDIIIVESGKTFAIKGEDGKLYLSNLRNSFASRSWLQTFAQGDRLKLVKVDSYLVKGYTLSFSCPDTPQTDGQEFWIASGNKGICVSAEDLKNKGTHSIYLNDGKIVVETVEARRGKRLWTSNQMDMTDEE